jgi:hypothetical protein
MLGLALLRPALRPPPDSCRTTPLATTATPEATSATLDATFATRLSAPLVRELAFLAIERRPDVLRPRDFAAARTVLRPPRFLVEARLARDFADDVERRLALAFRFPLFFLDALLRAAMVLSPFASRNRIKTRSRAQSQQ